MTVEHRNSHKILLKWCSWICLCILMGLPIQMVQSMSEYELVQHSHILKGEWPFIAALFEKPNRFRCGGSILSRKHVLTTAQCVHLEHSSTKYDRTEIIVRVGGTEIEEDINVSKIHVHEDWEPYGDRSNADIAILLLSIDATFNLHIRSICLPDNDAFVDYVNGRIVGWSNAEDEETRQTPVNSVESRILDDYHCDRNENSMPRIVPLRSFCAGYGSGEFLNISDYGAGFFVLSQSRWVQFGLFTTTPTNGTGHDAPQSAAAFTNVKWFTPWIETVMENDKWKIDRCWSDFMETYQCILVKADVGTNLVHRIGSPHMNGKTNHDVEAVFISNFTEFPAESKIAQTFRNLKKVEILGQYGKSTTLNHFLSSAIIEGMENLIELNFEFEVCADAVEPGFFPNFPNLEKIGFELTTHCLIYVLVNETTFQANSKLKKVFLPITGSIPGNLFKNNSMLETVRLIIDHSEIDERLFDSNLKLKDILIMGGEVKYLPWNLFKNNLMLETITLHIGLTQIDERTFETNEELKFVTVRGARLEFLPRDLFKNNLSLQEISFAGNKLKIIEIDFSVFKEIWSIDLQDNSCINYRFGEFSVNFSEFQRMINSSCISNSSSDRI